MLAFFLTLILFCQPSRDNKVTNSEQPFPFQGPIMSGIPEETATNPADSFQTTPFACALEAFDIGKNQCGVTKVGREVVEMGLSG